MKLLIVEDEHKVVDYLRTGLTEQGWIVDVALDGDEGTHLALEFDYDVIVLDVMLPGRDGFAVLRAIRSRKATPVIMLTARDQVADKIDGFESGLDDYLVKPVALQEIEVRLRSLVARRRQAGTAANVLSVADLHFDLGTLQVQRGEREVTLTRTGRRLLELLMRESPQVVSRVRLEHAAWGDAVPGTDLLRSHMYVLRRAIEVDDEPPLLHTVSGSGYRLFARD